MLKVQRSRVITTYPKIVYILFMIFFMFPVLSPMIGGTTGYIFIFIPFLDVNYLTFLLKGKYSKTKFALLVTLSLLPVFYLSFLFFFKIFTLLFIVLYFYYTYRKGLFYINYFILVHVFVAVIQYIGYRFLNLHILDPAQIAEFIFGSNATITGDTFNVENALGLRVSGLAREPGFFSALLISCFLITESLAKNSGFIRIIYLIGLVLSLSTISVAFFLIFLIFYPFRRWVSLMPQYLVVILVLGTMIISISYLYKKLPALALHPSILHRTIGYDVITKLKPTDLLFGVGFRNIATRSEEIPIIKENLFYEELPEVIVDNSGLTSIIIDLGLFYFLFLILILYCFKVDSFKLLLFCAMTINVNPFTTSSFVIIAVAYLFLKVKTNGVKKETYSINY